MIGKLKTMMKLLWDISQISKIEESITNTEKLLGGDYVHTK